MVSEGWWIAEPPMTDNGNGMKLSYVEPTPGKACDYPGCDNRADEALVWGDSRWRIPPVHTCSDHVAELLNQLLNSRDKLDSLSALGAKLAGAGVPVDIEPLKIEGPDFSAVGADVVVVKQGLLIYDDDPRWLKVWEHVSRYGLEQEFCTEIEDPRFNAGRGMVWLFMTPAAREASAPESIEALKREISQPGDAG